MHIHERIWVALLASGIAGVSGIACAQDAPAQLAPIIIEGENGTGGEEDFSGYAPERTVSATKGETPLERTPQAVSSVGAQQISDQAARTVMEATRYSPGIRSETFGADQRNDWFLIRGFSSQINSYFLDGLQLQSSDSFATWKMNPFLLERIDVLRGPSGALYGASNPGGLINMVSKRPEFRDGGEIGIGVNEYGNVWSGIDVQGVSEDANFAYRFVGTGNVGGTDVDFIENDQFALMPTLTWQPDDATKLTIYGHYSRGETKSLNFLPYEGSAVPAPFGYIPRDLFTSEPALDDFRREQAMVGYEFEHGLNDTVTVRQNLRYARLNVDIVGAYGLGWVGGDASSGLLDRGAFATSPDLGLFTVDNQVEVKAETGVLRHTLLFGIDYKNFDLYDPQAYGDATDFDILNPSYGGSYFIPAPFTTDVNQNQLGFYAQDRIDIDRLTLVLSGRYDFVDTDTLDVGSGTLTKQAADAFSGRAGVIYRFDNGLTPYASVARSFLPLVGTDSITSAPFTPETGLQYEAGFRYQPEAWGGGYVGAAVFDLTRENVVTSDGINFSRQIGKVNSRGLELEAAVNLTPELQLVGAYTVYDLKVKEGNPAEIGKVTTGTPEQFGSLWVNYRVPTGMFEGLSFGAGLRYVGSSYADGANTLKVDDALVADAAIRYERGRFGAALNVSNLFDKRYVAACNVTCYYAEGREANLTLTYKW